MLMKNELAKMIPECTGIKSSQFCRKKYKETINFLCGHLPGKLISKEGDI